MPYDFADLGNAALEALMFTIVFIVPVALAVYATGKLGMDR
jgi:hypothetical protein